MIVLEMELDVFMVIGQKENNMERAFRVKTESPNGMVMETMPGLSHSEEDINRMRDDEFIILEVTEYLLQNGKVIEIDVTDEFK